MEPQHLHSFPTRRSSDLCPATVSRGASPSPSSASARGASPTSDRKSTRLNSSHEWISYAVFCLKKKKHCANSSINFSVTDTNSSLTSEAALWPSTYISPLSNSTPCIRKDRISSKSFMLLSNCIWNPSIYTLSLHDALPICVQRRSAAALHLRQAQRALAALRQR